jgi:hypothetical protein
MKGKEQTMARTLQQQQQQQQGRRREMQKKLGNPNDGLTDGNTERMTDGSKRKRGKAKNERGEKSLQTLESGAESRFRVLGFRVLVRNLSLGFRA